MANTVADISYANTFGEWVVATNGLIIENNTLAVGDYTKSTGTIFLNETTKTSLQSNGNLVVQGTFTSQGIGSSARIQNNLTVEGQVYFSNTTLGLTNSGQANINGLLIAQGPNTSLSVANNTYMGGNTTIRYNTITNNLQANTSVNTTTFSATGGTYTDTLQANTSILTGRIQANSYVNTAVVSATATVYTNYLQANTSSNTSAAYVTGTTLTGILQANSYVAAPIVAATGTTFTDILQANTSTNTTSAYITTTTWTGALTANSYVQSPVLSANNIVYANIVQANTSTNTTRAYITGTTWTGALTANSYVQAPVLSANNTVYANTIQANTSTNTTSAYITGTTWTGALTANSYVQAPVLSANNTVYANTMQANVSVNTTTFSATGGTYTDTLQANTSTNTTRAYITTTTWTGALTANSYVQANVLSANNIVYANTVQANVSILTGTVQSNTSVNTAAVSVTGLTLTNSLQANTTVYANNSVTTNNIFSNVITANTSVTTNTINLNTKLDGNNAAGFLNSLYVGSGGLITNGNFVLTGTTIYTANTFQLSTGTPSGISSYIQVDRGSSGSNAALRWNEPLKYWEFLDVDSSTYYRIVTDEYITSSLTDTNTSNVASASLANTLHRLTTASFLQSNTGFGQANTANTLANNAFNRSNSAYATANSGFLQANTANTLANNAFDRSNSAYATANSGFLQANTGFGLANTANILANNAFATSNAAFLQANTGFTQANAAFLLANTANTLANNAYATANAAKTTFVGTSASFQANTIIFSSNNGVNFGYVGANTMAVNTPQDLRTSATPNFTGLTLTNSLGAPSGGHGATSLGAGFQALIFGHIGSYGTAGQVLSTNGSGTYTWAASGGGGGGGAVPGTTINSSRASYTANGVAGYTGNTFAVPAALSATQVRPYINGVRQFEGEYSLSLGASSNTISFTTTPVSSDLILIEVDGYVINPYYANNIPFTVNANIGATANTIQLALDGLTSKLTTYYANTASTPTFTVPVLGTTMAAGTSNTAFATTAYVQSLANSSGTLTTSISGNAGTVTNGVYTNGSYADPARITSLSASKLTLGTIPSATLGSSTVYIGSTGIALNRGTGNLGLTGITSIAMPGSTSGTVTLQPTAAAGTTTITLPATTGTVVTTGDSGTVTSTMIADATIVNADISASAAIAISKLAQIYAANTSGFATVATSASAADLSTGTLAAARLPFTMDQAVATTSNVQHFSIGVGTPASSANGEIRAISTITAGYSDDQLKTKLGNIDNALDKLMTLNGFYYEPSQLALDLGYTPSKQVGVSAQEVQKVLPEVVVPAPIDAKYLTVHYEKMIPLLIEAIKELKSEVEVLKGQIK